MEKKTVIEWLEQANAQGFEWANAAIENTHEDGHTASLTRYSLSEALSTGFRWRNSAQGIGYWIDIHDMLLEKNL